MYALNARRDAADLRQPFDPTPLGGTRGRWRPEDLLLWRARWGVMALAAVALLALGLGRAAGVGPFSAGQGSGAAGRYETVVVARGDTLWTIAARRYPESDTRQKVGEIEEANGLAGPAIEAGQRLRLPIR